MTGGDKLGCLTRRSSVEVGISCSLVCDFDVESDRDVTLDECVGAGLRLCRFLSTVPEVSSPVTIVVKASSRTFHSSKPGYVLEVQSLLLVQLNPFRNFGMKKNGGRW